MYLYVLTLICAVFAAVIGLSNPDTVNISIGKYNFTLHFAIICALCFVSGVLATFFTMSKTIMDVKKSQSQLRKKFEKTSIGADDSELRVKTLENKIKTLEAALEKSLKNSK